MATLEKANGLLEELRGASYDAAVKDMEELKKYAAENVSPAHHASPKLCLAIISASAHKHLLSRRDRSLYLTIMAMHDGDASINSCVSSKQREGQIRMEQSYIIEACR